MGRNYYEFESNGDSLKLAYGVAAHRLSNTALKLREGTSKR